MIEKIEASDLVGDGPIRVLYPGMRVAKTDTGFASIGRIDHARFEGDTLISMHPHVNDEILTYLRSGHVEHLDSEGHTATLNNTHLMLMKAGKSFFHEEQIVDKGEPLTGLQIFIRPATKDLKPEVSFLTLDSAFSNDQWRLLATPDGETDLTFSSRTWIYDIRCSAGRTFTLPCDLNDGKVALLYVFDGHVAVNEEVDLSNKEGVIVVDEPVSCLVTERTDIVLFVADRSVPCYTGGMFSGNQARESA